MADEVPAGPEDDNQTVLVTLILYDRFGSRQAHCTVSRAAHDESVDLLYDEICRFLQVDDFLIWELSAIRVEAADDTDDPYPPRLLFDRDALPHGVLDRPREFDLGIVRNRQMNLRDYIYSGLYNLLRIDMLNMTAPDDPIPHRHWTISMTAPDLYLSGRWRTQADAIPLCSNTECEYRVRPVR
jgi:hypothetical protein